MRNRFDRQLEQLNNELIQMGSMIEHAIEMAVSALVNQDTEKAKKQWHMMWKSTIRSVILNPYA